MKKKQRKKRQKKKKKKKKTTTKKMEKVFICSGTEVGANGGFKSFAIERRRFSPFTVLFLG